MIYFISKSVCYRLKAVNGRKMWQIAEGGISMVLKKNAASYIVWMMFVAFNIIMVVAFSIYSGLFPVAKKMETAIFTGAFTSLSACICLVISFLISRLSEFFRPLQKKADVLSSWYRVIMLILILAGDWIRIVLLKKAKFSIGAGMQLFRQASVRKSSMTITTPDIWHVIYIKILRGILYFTGNLQSTALVYQLVLELLSIFIFSMAIRLFMGKTASVITMALLVFLPVFSENPQNLNAYVYTELFMAVEIFAIGVCIRIIRGQKPFKKILILPFLILGSFFGFMFYLDAGTILIMLLFASFLFSYDTSKKKILGAYLFLFVGMIAGFFIGIVSISNLSGISVQKIIYLWKKSFFDSNLSFEGFNSIGNFGIKFYALLYLILALVLLTAVCSFIFQDNITTLTPWMILMLASVFVSPMMGNTLINTLKIWTALGASVIAGGFACMLHIENEYMIDIVSEKERVSGKLEIQNAEEYDTSQNEAYVQKIDKDENGKESDVGTVLNDYKIIEKTDTTENEELTENADTEENEELTENGDTTENEELTENGDTAENEELTENGDTTRNNEELESADTPSNNEQTEYKEIANINELKENLKKVVDEVVHNNIAKEEMIEDNQKNSEKVNERVEDSKKYEDEKASCDDLEDLFVTGESFVEEQAIDSFLDNGSSKPLFVTDYSSISSEKGAVSKNKEEKVTRKREKAESAKVRFIPEGMVVPEDNEEDLVPHPHLSGFNDSKKKVQKLKVGRNMDRNEFDLPLKSGDDFDV